WLALADPNVHDRPREQSEKTILRQEWGNWQKCSERMQPSLRRDVVIHLARQPADFKRSIAVFPHPLRSLWLAAFQSHLWNQLLAGLIRHELSDDQTQSQPIGLGRLPFFRELSQQQRTKLQTAVLPLPSARLHLENAELLPLYNEVLAAEGIELRQVRVKY